jgi:ribosomal protein S18 acetylase RimI-like enzyme/DNA-binding MarR family transcriptional regulator
MEQFGILAFGSRLKRLSDYLFAEVQQIYERRRIPISSTYFPILRLLQSQGELSVVEIADQLGISHPAVSKQVTKMQGDGLLTKKGDARDQRRSFLCLSEKGKTTMAMVEPVLVAIRTTLEELTESGSLPFMKAFDGVEARIFRGGFADAVLHSLAISAFQVVPFDDADRDHFKTLNLEWLEGHFPGRITDHDLSILQEPEQQILDKGGAIWFARPAGDTAKPVIGTVALRPVSEEEYEIIKLAVTPSYQRQGVATLLLDTAIECARQRGASLVSLETASSLEAATRLYERLGFSLQPSPRKSSVDRADMYMVLPLSATPVTRTGDAEC